MVEPSYTHTDVGDLFNQPTALAVSDPAVQKRDHHLLFLGWLLIDVAQLAREAACAALHDRLEQDLATTEAAPMQVQAQSVDEMSHDPWQQRRLSRREIHDPWIVRQNPTSPARDAANSRLFTAKETKQRRWVRMRAQACGLADLPEELYSLIVPHVECTALAPLALTNTSWSAAVATHFVSREFWESRTQIQYTGSGLRNHTEFWARLSLWSTSALRLVGALACRCSGPAELVKLLHAAQQSVSVDGADSNFLEGLIFYYGPEEFGPQLVKCGRVEDWTKELVLEVTLLYVEVDEINAANSLDSSGGMAHLALALVGSMQTDSALSRGFSVSVREVFVLLLTRVTSRENRSRMIMGNFAEFVEGYMFREEERSRSDRSPPSPSCQSTTCVPHALAPCAARPYAMCLTVRPSSSRVHLPTSDGCARLATAST